MVIESAKSYVNFWPHFPLKSDLNFSKAWLPTGIVRWVKLAQKAKYRVQWGTVCFYLHWSEILYLTFSRTPAHISVPPAFGWNCLPCHPSIGLLWCQRLLPAHQTFPGSQMLRIPSFTVVYEAKPSLPLWPYFPSFSCKDVPTGNLREWTGIGM